MSEALPTVSAIIVGEYVMSFPQERPGDRDIARTVMKRNGCLSLGFELRENGTLVAHGYLAFRQDAGAEPL